MEKIFSGKTAIISGGLGDIGFATATELAKRGANVSIGDNKDPSLATAPIGTLRQYGVQCSYQQLDIADAGAVRSWVEETDIALGTPSIIVPNAGQVTLKSFFELSADDWKKELEVNLHGAFYLAQEASRLLLAKQATGRVVFVGSWAGTRVHQHIPAYSVSKAGVAMLSKCLAMELAPHGILVNEIAPGYVSAGLSGRIWKESPGKEEKARQRVPINQVMTAQEVAENIIFLCHPDNKQMTGSTLLMDGGLSIK